MSDSAGFLAVALLEDLVLQAARQGDHPFLRSVLGEECIPRGLVVDRRYSLIMDRLLSQLVLDRYTGIAKLLLAHEELLARERVSQASYDEVRVDLDPLTLDVSRDIDP